MKFETNGFKFDFKKVMDEAVKHQAEEMRDRIFSKEMFGGSAQSRGSYTVSIPRPQGSTDLFSPDGKLLMRDGKLVS